VSASLYLQHTMGVSGGGGRGRVQPSACAEGGGAEGGCATERVCKRARVQPSACATERVCDRARVKPSTCNLCLHPTTRRVARFCSARFCSARFCRRRAPPSHSLRSRRQRSPLQAQAALSGSSSRPLRSHVHALRVVRPAPNQVRQAAAGVGGDGARKREHRVRGPHRGHVLPRLDGDLERREDPLPLRFYVRAHLPRHDAPLQLLDADRGLGPQRQVLLPPPHQPPEGALVRRHGRQLRWGGSGGERG
jgi:hypothetical protein